MLRILATAFVLTVIAAVPGRAQNALPPELANEIDRAAMSTLRPNLAIETVVVEAVVEHPGLVDSIVARAVARDPAADPR
ncbi:MAG: hypothetical protein HOK81_04880 [Rhodospirillaceae bacterium]|nr:hypothetical protein [Rhodospirillaceae bacterium]